MRRLGWVGALSWALLACDDRADATEDPAPDVGVTRDADVGAPEADGGRPPPPPSPPKLGDPCAADADCQPGATPGLTCLPPGSLHAGGRPIVEGMCSQPCDGDHCGPDVACADDDRCPPGSACSLLVEGVYYCTPLCDPSQPASCDRDDLRCGLDSACLPRCTDDASCPPGLKCLAGARCANPGFIRPEEARRDGQPCRRHAQCRAGAVCLQGFCSMPGCHLGGDRACLQPDPELPAVACVRVPGLSSNPATERRRLSACAPACDVLADTCPTGSTCYPPEAEVIQEAPGPVCFIGGEAEGGSDIGRPCQQITDCRDGLDGTRLHDCFLPDPHGLFPEGRCTTHPGACANPQLRRAGLCGAEGDCFALHGPGSATCHRACGSGAACPDGDVCYPYAANPLGGHRERAPSEVGVCLPPCHRLGLQLCRRNNGESCGESGVCPLWLRCDPDAAEDECGAGRNCYLVSDPLHPDALRVRPGARPGVCLEACAAAVSSWCRPVPADCAEGVCGGVCDEGACVGECEEGTCPIAL